MKNRFFIITALLLVFGIIVTASFNFNPQTKQPFKSQSDISITYVSSGGLMGQETQVLIQNKTIEVHHHVQGKKQTYQKTLSKKEYQNIKKAVDDISFNDLYKRYDCMVEGQPCVINDYPHQELVLQNNNQVKKIIITAPNEVPQNVTDLINILNGYVSSESTNTQ